MMNKQTIDIISNNSLSLASEKSQSSEKSTLKFEEDRFFTSDSAVKLIGSEYFKAPPNVYFNGDFSITAWIKLDSTKEVLPTISFKLLDFGNKNGNILSDNIIIQVQNGLLSATIYQGDISSTVNTIISTNKIKLEKWFHVAFTLSGSSGYLYLNGVQIGNNTSMKAPLNVRRSINIIGGSSASLDLTLDDIKIFIGSLDSNEVYLDYNPGNN